MKTPGAEDWDLLVMGALEDAAAERLLELARTDENCRAQFLAARRAHAERVRMYETFDRDHDDLREQLMAALPADPPARGGPVLRVWRRCGELAMSLNTTATRRIAAVIVPAACILAGVLFFLMPGDNIALAAVIERMRAAQTIVCQIETYMNDADEPMTTGTIRMSDTFGSRIDMESLPGQQQTIWRSPSGPALIYMPQFNTVMRVEGMENSSPDGDTNSPDEYIRRLCELTGDADRRLGRDVIDGREVEGFELGAEKLGLVLAPPPAGEDDTPRAAMRIWVDIDTRLPARIEVELVTHTFGVGHMHILVVQDRFEWDVRLDAALFDPDIPEDARQVDMVVPPPTEQTLIDGLREFAEVVGSYPAALDPTQVGAQFSIKLATSEQMEIDPQNPFAGGLAQSVMGITQGCVFFGQLVRDGLEPEYNGDYVLPGDADEVLLTWHLDAKHVRVIYGDLRAETIPDED